MCIFYDIIIGIIINILKVFNHVFNFISQVFNSTRCSRHSNIIHQILLQFKRKKKFFILSKFYDKEDENNLQVY